MGYETLLEYTERYENGHIESVTVRKTDAAAYPCGYDYSFHYGTTNGETILRYDNAHEQAKGHERHTSDGVERIDFPGIRALYDRFRREIKHEVDR
ncbi:MAG: DUF6516 family protein [Halobacteriales archaeon]|nr:DUF6516 family protein [Halobacteriales archaeon]